LYEEKHPGKTSDHDPAFAKRLKIFNQRLKAIERAKPSTEHFLFLLIQWTFEFVASSINNKKEYLL